MPEAERMSEEPVRLLRTIEHPHPGWSREVPAESEAEFRVRHAEWRIQNLTSDLAIAHEEMLLTNENEHRIMTDLLATREERDRLTAELAAERGKRGKAERLLLAIQVRGDSTVTAHVFRDGVQELIERFFSQEPAP